MALVFRGKKFLSIPEAAEQLGVTRLTVYRWVRGMRRAPATIAPGDTIRDTRSGQSYLPEAIVRRLAEATRRRSRSSAPRRRARR